MSKIWRLLASTASERKSIKYQWKMRIKQLCSKSERTLDSKSHKMKIYTQIRWLSNFHELNLETITISSWIPLFCVPKSEILWSPNIFYTMYMYRFWKRWGLRNCVQKVKTNFRYLYIYALYYRPVLEVDSNAVHFYKPEGLFRIYMDCLYVHILEFARLSNFQGLSSVVLV